MLTQRMEKKFNGNYTRRLRAILDKSWRQRPTKHRLYGHLPSITKTIKVRWTRHVGHCWRNRNELISDVLLWSPLTWPSKSRATCSNIHTVACEDTECSPDDLPEAMNDREEWRVEGQGYPCWWHDKMMMNYRRRIVERIWSLFNRSIIINNARFNNLILYFT